MRVFARGDVVRLLVAVVSCVAVSVMPQAAQAQQKYPDKPVRIIVPFTAGGATDIIARVMAQGLTETLGQTVVIENRPGAGSNLGANAVARSEPDGYTVLIASSGIIASPALYRNLSYDIFRDLAPVAELVVSTNVMVAGNKTGITSIADMLREARAHPDRLN